LMKLWNTYGLRNLSGSDRGKVHRHRGLSSSSPDAEGERRGGVLC
jgi:hypothetical protein